LPGSPQPDGWEVLPASPSSPANSRHEDIVFVDASNGWLVNGRAEVWGTQDGGNTWRQLAQLPGDVVGRSIAFGSPEKGWVGNLNFTTTPRENYALWETLDGGRTWSNISTRISGAPVAGLCGMRVLSPSVILAVGRWSGPPVFVKSIDGGSTWTSRSLSPLTSGLVDVFFFNELDGFAVGGLGDGPTEAEQRASRTVILATADGGETWQTRYTSTAVGQRAWKIHFANDRVGYVTTEGATAEGVVVKTTDGGANWRAIPVSSGRSFEGVGFVDADRGWVASGDSLFSTADGGMSWRPLAFGVSINRIRVVNDSLVYACGDRVYRWRR
jgi:photosystem II stability/assembly factor-like uncharacterized protein